MERGWFGSSMTLFFAIKPSSLAATSAPRRKMRRGNEGRNEMKDGGKREWKKESISCALYKCNICRRCPARITRLPLPFFPPSPRRVQFFARAVAPTANGEIMIKPTSFQWNDGNYRVGYSRIPVFPALFKSRV